MAKVKRIVDSNGNVETVDSMLKRFKKLVLKENIMYEVRRREYFVKKPLARKLKAEEAIRRQKNKKEEADRMPIAYNSTIMILLLLVAAKIQNLALKASLN